MEGYAAMKARMEKAWALVCPTLYGAASWREKVRAFVNEREMAEVGTTLPEVLEAIEFYTGTKAATKEYPMAEGGKGWLVEAVGYRMGPCGP